MTSFQAIKRIIIIALLVKIVYFIMAFVLVNYYDVQFRYSEAFRLKNLTVDHLRILSRNDSGWYAKIAMNGHGKITAQDLPTDQNIWKQSYYAFFPLYPYSIRAFLAISGEFSKENFTKVAFVFSILFSLGCFCCFFLFAKDYFEDINKAFEATLLLILFPFHYYFSTYYTEAPFLLLILGCYLSINRKNYLVLYLLSCLLVLTRPNGILISIPLALWFLEKEHWSLSRKNIIRVGALLLVMSLTLLSYCVYLKYMTGNFFAFSTAQKGWGRVLSNPFSTLLNVTTTNDILISVYTALFISITAIFYKKFSLSFLALIGIGLFMPISYGIVMSMPRFITVLFPFMFLFTIYLYPLSAIKKYLIYFVLFVVHVITFATWLLAMPFSF